MYVYDSTMSEPKNILEWWEPNVMLSYYGSTIPYRYDSDTLNVPNNIFRFTFIDPEKEIDGLEHMLKVINTYPFLNFVICRSYGTHYISPSNCTRHIQVMTDGSVEGIIEMYGTKITDEGPIVSDISRRITPLVLIDPDTNEQKEFRLIEFTASANVKGLSIIQFGIEYMSRSIDDDVDKDMEPLPGDAIFAKCRGKMEEEDDTTISGADAILSLAVQYLDRLYFSKEQKNDLFDINRFIGASVSDTRKTMLLDVDPSGMLYATLNVLSDAYFVAPMIDYVRTLNGTTYSIKPHIDMVAGRSTTTFSSDCVIISDEMNVNGFPSMTSIAEFINTHLNSSVDNVNSLISQIAIQWMISSAYSDPLHFRFVDFMVGVSSDMRADGKRYTSLAPNTTYTIVTTSRYPVNMAKQNREKCDNIVALGSKFHLIGTINENLKVCEYIGLYVLDTPVPVHVLEGIVPLCGIFAVPLEIVIKSNYNIDGVNEINLFEDLDPAEKAKDQLMLMMTSIKKLNRWKKRFGEVPQLLGIVNHTMYFGLYALKEPKKNWVKALDTKTGAFRNVEDGIRDVYDIHFVLTKDKLPQTDSDGDDNG